MGCVFSFRMAPDVSFTSAADAPSAAGIRDFPAGFASLMQRYEKFLIPANFFPTFFQKSAQKGRFLLCTHLRGLPCSPPKPILLTSEAAFDNQEGFSC